MDLVCAEYATVGACDTEGCTWDANAVAGAGLCKSEKLGYDCNSYLTFTSTNWKSWQTLKVIAVDDDEECVAVPGHRLYILFHSRAPRVVRCPHALGFFWRFGLFRVPRSDS